MRVQTQMTHWDMEWSPPHIPPISRTRCLCNRATSRHMFYAIFHYIRRRVHEALHYFGDPPNLPFSTVFPHRADLCAVSPLHVLSWHCGHDGTAHNTHVSTRLYSLTNMGGSVDFQYNSTFLHGGQLQSASVCVKIRDVACCDWENPCPRDDKPGR